MREIFSKGVGRLVLSVAAMFLLRATLMAYPPAPPHTFYGIVRDAIGNPMGDGGEVIFESASGVRIRGFVLAEAGSSINYRIQVPMDAGLTASAYSPTALMPAAPFKFRVRVGRSTYLPMEMAGDFSRLGAPGGATRLDLTLGVDEDGNGLPDGWEKAVAAFLGKTWKLGAFNGTDVYPGTGMSFRDVYLAGTYALNPSDGFALQIKGGTDSPPRLFFTAVKGRSYTVEAAEKLGQWTRSQFQVLENGKNGATIGVFVATATRRIEIEPDVGGGGPARFYRLRVE